MSWHAGVLGDRGIDWPRAVLIGLGLAVVLAVGAVATTSTAAFGPYNPSWDGSSDLREQLERESDVEVELLRDPSRYEDTNAEGTTAFVVAPGESYRGADASRIRRFVEDGGRLVVFENVGEAGNSLLADVGADARTDGRVLRDDYRHSNGPTIPIATGVRNHTLTGGVEQLTLNYATAVEPNAATVLVTTSDLATLGDTDQRLDLTAHPVATVEPVGDGEVVVVGDPSLTINAMVGEPDNAAFLRSLYAGSDRVLLDRSHVGDLPPLTAAVLTVRDAPLLQLLLGSVGITAVGLWSTGRLRPLLERVRRRRPGSPREGPGRERGVAGRVRRAGPASSTGPDAELELDYDLELERSVVDPGLSRAERADVLRRRHPDWEERRIRRVLASTARAENRAETDYGHR
ncbi:DUF4350 domain-containing protein [Halomontanus rarus]|uniref:DUF4350 domain-containing protein n=1 Tax=Halomontanus rarus TaxID=3034020 RepID=UPI0023E85CAF|nr:DUF4350 domain-containing protein [Halovivax sp. TS33]